MIVNLHRKKVLVRHLAISIGSTRTLWPVLAPRIFELQILLIIVVACHHDKMYSTFINDRSFDIYLASAITSNFRFARQLDNTVATPIPVGKEDVILDLGTHELGPTKGFKKAVKVCSDQKLHGDRIEPDIDFAVLTAKINALDLFKHLIAQTKDLYHDEHCRNIFPYLLNKKISLRKMRLI